MNMCTPLKLQTVILILIPKIDHHTGKNCLNGLFLFAGSGEGQGDACILFLDPELGLATANIIDDGDGQLNSGGDGCADNITACLGIAAVSGDGESSDSLVLSNISPP